MIDVILDGADTLKTMIGYLRNQLEGKVMPEEPIDLAPLLEQIEMVEKETPQGKEDRRDPRGDRGDRRRGVKAGLKGRTRDARQKNR